MALILYVACVTTLKESLKSTANTHNTGSNGSINIKRGGAREEGVCGSWNEIGWTEVIEIVHMQRRIEKENQSGASPIPPMLLSLFLAALLPPPLVQRVPRVIDVKRVFILHAGVLCKSPPLLSESQLVTQPVEINNIVEIIN